VTRLTAETDNETVPRPHHACHRYRPLCGGRTPPKRGVRGSLDDAQAQPLACHDGRSSTPFTVALWSAFHRASDFGWTAKRVSQSISPLLVGKETCRSGESRAAVSAAGDIPIETTAPLITHRGDLPYGIDYARPRIVRKSVESPPVCPRT